MANRRIDINAVIDRVRLREQAGDPAIPTAGFGWIFERNDGKFYVMNDAGNVFGPLGERYFTLTVADDLEVATGNLRLYNLTGRALTISKVHLAVNTAPVGASILVDIHENGTTIFTTQGNRPAILTTEFIGQSVTIDDPSWADGNYLQADVDQIGVATVGADLTVTVVAS